MAKIVPPTPPVIVPDPVVVPTPTVVGQSVSEKSSIVPTILDYQLTRLTEKECLALGVASTSKGFPRLGIDPADGRSIIWAHANFIDEDSRLIEGFCKSQDIRTCDLMARVCMEWVEKNRDEMILHAEKFIQVMDTAQTIDKKIAAAERNYALLLKRRELLLAAAELLEIEESETNTPTE